MKSHKHDPIFLCNKGGLKGDWRGQTPNPNKKFCGALPPKPPFARIAEVKYLFGEGSMFFFHLLSKTERVKREEKGLEK